jgi:hypothetical protein
MLSANARRGAYLVHSFRRAENPLEGGRPSTLTLSVTGDPAELIAGIGSS